MTALAIWHVPLINATKSLGFVLAQVALTLTWASGQVLISNPVIVHMLLLNIPVKLLLLSPCLVLSGFPPKQLIFRDESTLLSTVDIRSGDTLIIEEDKKAPRVSPDSYKKSLCSAALGKITRKQVSLLCSLFLYSD